MELLEREAAQEVLSQALRSVRSGEGRLVLVGGEAGVGKTSLVEHFTSSPECNLRTLHGYCEALSTPRPLGPIRDMAEQLGSDLARLLSAESKPTDVLQGMLKALRRPATIVIEDAHWSDEATLDLLKLLGRRIQSMPALIIVTYRDDEVGHDHPLRSVLGALATSQAVLRIALSSLSLDGVRRLVAGSGHDPERLFFQTGGNPFFVVEMLGVADGETVPRSVRDIVLERASRLSAPAREVLETAAVIGHQFHARRLADHSDAAIQACMELGLVRSVGTKLVFRHELVRQAILDAIPATRLAACHAHVLARLVDTDVRDAARLAHHAEAAGDIEALCEHATAAAWQATGTGANRQAAAQFERVLAHIGRDRPRERAELLEGYAEVLSRLDRQDEAVSKRSDAIQLWQGLGDKSRAGRNLAAMAWPLVRSGQNREAEDAVRDAIGLLEPLGETAELAEALRMKAHLRMLDRDKSGAMHWGRRAIAMAQQLGETRTFAAANLVVGAALLVSDDAQGHTYLDRCMEIAVREGLEDLVALVHANIGSSYGEQYHFEKAERVLQQGIDHAIEHDLDYLRYYSLAWLALTRLHRGDWPGAERLAAETLRQDKVSTVSRIMALVALGRIRARRGEDGAGKVLDEALNLAQPTGTLQRLAPVRLARAEAAWLAGNVEQARSEAEAVWGLALGHRHKWHVGESAYWRQLAGETVTLPDWADSPYSLQLAGKWREAAAAWRERGCAYEQARALASGDEQAQMEALRILDRLGAGPAALFLRRQMREAGAAGVSRGPRLSTRQNELGLTPRQAQVADLLAEGASNLTIARRLGISAKTVEHHVSAVFAKLEVDSRDEAARIVGARR